MCCAPLRPWYPNFEGQGFVGMGVGRSKMVPELTWSQQGSENEQLGDALVDIQTGLTYRKESIFILGGGCRDVCAVG